MKRFFFGLFCAIVAFGALHSNAQDKSTSLTAYGAYGFAAGGYNEVNTGTLAGVGADFGLGGFSFGLKFLARPRFDTQSQIFDLNGPVFESTERRRNMLLAGIPQYDIGPRRGPVVLRLGGGPALFLQQIKYSGRVVHEPPGFAFDPSVTNSRNEQFHQVGVAINASVIVRIKSWGRIESGILFFKPFTNMDQTRSGSYLMPLAGAGVAF